LKAEAGDAAIALINGLFNCSAAFSGDRVHLRVLVRSSFLNRIYAHF
jgi:hypothetical protein